MRKHWTEPNEDAAPGEIIFNCALFRYFGTIDFADALGWQTQFKAEKIIETVSELRLNKRRVFTGAYIIPTLGKTEPKHMTICRYVLPPLWNNREALADIAIGSQSWRMVGEKIMQLPGFGGSGFMAKETLLDVMQTPVLRDAHDRNSWCPAGPGAQRGLNRLSARRLKATIPFNQALHEMTKLFDESKQRLAAWMPDLELHDIQFQLCEFDKYERARLSEGRPKTKYVPNL
jgi:hypothetical protein